jgi:hypothetical protein
VDVGVTQTRSEEIEMTIVYFQFPGDPVLPVFLQTGREFLAGQRRPREVVIRTDDNEQRYDLGDDMACDACNVEIGLNDHTALTGNRLYCPQCIAEYITPYLVAPAPV